MAFRITFDLDAIRNHRAFRPLHLSGSRSRWQDCPEKPKASHNRGLSKGQTFTGELVFLASVGLRPRRRPIVGPARSIMRFSVHPSGPPGESPWQFRIGQQLSGPRGDQPAPSKQLCAAGIYGAGDKSTRCFLSGSTGFRERKDFHDGPRSFEAPSNVRRPGPVRTID